MLLSEKHGNIEIILSHLINLIHINKANQAHFEESLEELFCIIDFTSFFKNIPELSLATKLLIEYTNLRVCDFSNKFKESKNIENYANNQSWMEFTKYLLKPTTLLIIEDFKNSGYKTQHLENML